MEIGQHVHPDLMVGKQELQICTAKPSSLAQPSCPALLPPFQHQHLLENRSNPRQAEFPGDFHPAQGHMRVKGQRPECRAHITQGPEEIQREKRMRREREKEEKTSSVKGTSPHKLTSHVMTSSDLLPPPPLTSEGGISGTVGRKGRDVSTEQRQENTAHHPQALSLTHIHQGNGSGVGSTGKPQP